MSFENWFPKLLPFASNVGYRVRARRQHLRRRHRPRGAHPWLRRLQPSATIPTSKRGHDDCRPRLVGAVSTAHRPGARRRRRRSRVPAMSNPLRDNGSLFQPHVREAQRSHVAPPNMPSATSHRCGARTSAPSAATDSRSAALSAVKKLLTLCLFSSSVEVSPFLRTLLLSLSILAGTRGRSRLRGWQRHFGWPAPGPSHAPSYCQPSCAG